MAVNKRNPGTKNPSAPAASAAKKKKTQITGFISDLDCYLFGAGTHYDIYQKLGAIPRPIKGKRASTLRCGRPMPGRFIWLAILMDGTPKPIP